MPNLIKDVRRKLSEVMGTSSRKSKQMANVGTDASKLMGRLGLNGQEEAKNLLLGGSQSRDVGENRDLSMFQLFSEQVSTSSLFYGQINYKNVSNFLPSLHNIKLCIFAHSENALNP